MFDFTVGQVVVLASLAAMLLGRREMKAAAFYAGKFTGHTVGMLRRYRARLQAVIQEADVPMQSLQDDLHKSMSEVQSIRDELSALTNFSPQMLQHGKFDLREEELHSAPVFVDDGRDARRKAARANTAAEADSPVSPTWDGPNPGAATASFGSGATTASVGGGAGPTQAGAAASPRVRSAPMDPLDALLASAFTPPRAAEPGSGQQSAHTVPAAGGAGEGGGQPAASPRQHTTTSHTQPQAAGGSDSGARQRQAPSVSTSGSTGASSGGAPVAAAVAAGAPSWATDEQYTTPLDKYSEFTNKTDRVPGGADLVLQSVSDRKWLREYARQQAQSQAPPLFNGDDDTGSR